LQAKNVALVATSTTGFKLESKFSKESPFMNAKKLALAAAVAGALGAAGSASATIIGVPSEGLLVPLGIQGANYEGGNVYVGAVTGVLIETPALVGADTIINDYTAPNTTKGGYTPPGTPGDWDGSMTVHYYMFDEKSEHVYDSIFVMSPNDVYFWTPPCSIFNYGEAPCGSKNWIGYVVFADEAARKGGPATFVMTGQAGIALDLGWAIPEDGEIQVDDIIDIPVVPLADGDDAGGIRIGNEITYSKQQLPRIDDVVPLVAGTRYSGAPSTTTTIVTGLIPIVPGALTFWGGPSAEIWAISHVMWFSENGMHADIDFCDDEEWCVSCTDWTFNEVNILKYDVFGNMWDDVAWFKGALSHNPVVNQQKVPYNPKPAGDTCGVWGTEYSFEDSPGIGMALYEFASKAGVAGVNFQVGVSWLEGDNFLTAPMLANGQF